MEQLYRISYYAGVQALRLLHRMGRFLTLLFLPIRLLLGHITAWSRRHRGRALRVKLHAFIDHCRGGVRRVRTAWHKKPILGVLQVMLLPLDAVRRYRRVSKGVLTVAAITLSAFVLQQTFRYWTNITFALALTDAQGETFGYVSDEAELQAGMVMAQERLESTEATIDTVVKPDVALHMIPQANILDRTEICDYLLSRTDVPLSRACGVYVNDTFYGAVTHRNHAEKLLEDILEESRDGQEDVTASFFETVQLIDGRYPQSRVMEMADMKEQLTNEESEMHLKTVVSGTIQYEIEVPFEVQRVADASSYEGIERVRTKGENGTSMVTATVTYLDGKQLSSVITSSRVIKEPITQIVAYGTKKANKYYTGGANATGRFIWPVPETRYVSQYYQSGRHNAIDIWSRDMTGQDIVAADGGTVIVAEDPKGTSYWSYGKYIIIDHGGGYQTLYSHCHELFVKEGDKVMQGQRIASVGNTGRSTSPHLHFEVRVNGRTVNPLKFY